MGVVAGHQSFDHCSLVFFLLLVSYHGRVVLVVIAFCLLFSSLALFVSYNDEYE